MKSLQRFQICFQLLALLALTAPAFCQSGPPPLPVPIGDLNVWTLEQPEWLSTYGDTALGFTNLCTQPSWSDAGTALSVDTNGAAWLDLYVYEPYGWTNVVFDEGTISFWYQANWTSVADGGAGPTNWASLLNIGQWSSNAEESCWSLVIDPSGSNLFFLAQSNGNQQAISVPIDFDAGDWHDVALTYSASNFSLYLEGQLATNAAPITNWPSDEVCSNGMFIGSDATGIFQGRGQFQDLETYNYLLTAGEIAQNYSDISSIILNWGGTVPGSGFYTDDSGPPNPGGGTDTNYSGSSPEGITYTQPSFVITTNYSSYTNFWLAISNSPTEVSVSVMSTLPGLTYVILTNDDLTTTNWGIWQVLLASNSITIAPPLALNSNALFFEGALEFSTGTNGLPDYWCMEYFGTLNVSPFADADGDGLCNMAEYTFGTNPTNAHSISSTHTDAQALYLAYTNDPACHYRLFVTNGPDTNTVLVTMSNTLVGSYYQIYSQVVSATNGPWIVETNFLGTATATTVAISLNGRSLNFVGGSGEDTDGDGLPDGYEVLSTLTDPTLPDTGLTGVTDGYKDPDGDGYANLQEYYNGTDPHVFNTPAGVAGLVADFPSGTNSVTFSWQPASGNVTGYIIDVWEDSTENWIAIATNSATELSYVLLNPINYSIRTATSGSFGIQPIYADGSAPLNTGGVNVYPVTAHAALVHGPGGKTFLLVSSLNTNVIGYNVNANYFGTQYPEVPAYGQITTNYPSDWYFASSNIYIPASQFTNGIAIQSDLQALPYVSQGDFLTAQFSAGELGFTASTPSVYNAPFVDGTSQMKENVRYLLRAANSQPFTYTVSGISDFVYPVDHVYSTYYYIYPGDTYGYGGEAILNHFAPFEDNYFFCNLVFNESLVDSSGFLNTGFYPPEYTPPDMVYPTVGFTQYTNAAFQFPTYSYVTSSNAASIGGLLASNATPWVGYYMGNENSEYGIYGSGDAAALSPASNVYGLTYNSLELTVSNGSIQFDTLTPTHNVVGYTTLPLYLGTAEPNLQTVSYYFARPAAIGDNGLAAAIDPMPGYQDGSFAVTNTTPMMIGSVGTSMLVAGFAKQEVMNGSNNVFAYLGQYFTNAFVMSNGVVTTNPAGILSEYGEFFPTVPGQVGLLTKPDPDQTNIQGTCLIDIIRLSLDVNHDGIMDETYTGPDNTGAYSSTPFVFWANNDYDRYVGTNEEDLQTAATPDCNYTINGNRCIPCPRDLEDYARLWVSGVSNTLSRLPTGSTVTLSWGDVGAPNTNNPVIDIFQAADTNGGMSYLTNLATASTQINTNLCQYIGRLGPGGSIQLNAATFSNSWAGDHYIWCGVLGGSGQLFLTMADGSGNQLAQSSQYIQIKDIKQMYERWTVGDDPSTAPGAPLPEATNVLDNFSPGYPKQPFNYSYDPDYDTNDDYIVFVHGWNMPEWDKDRFAETAYKRLYWQGYQGRFGAFHWPCNLFDPTGLLTLNLAEYNIGERTAWQCGQPFETFLADLNGYYPGHVYVLAHSMGNVVTGEALRLAGANEIVNTYVATQGAISARAYDNTVPADATNSYTPHVYTPDSEGHYYTNGAPPYFNGIGGAFNFVDYYNPADYALRFWVKDQNAKPNSSSYFYTTPSLQFPSGYYNRASFLTTRSLVFPTNTYEIFSMAAQSYSFALGAETNIASRFSGIAAINLNAAPYNFGSFRTGHSFQFYSDNMTVGVYWHQLISSFGITH